MGTSLISRAAIAVSLLVALSASCADSDPPKTRAPVEQAHTETPTSVSHFERTASGFVTTSGDCDDQDDNIYPGAEEHCDGVDEDCDDVIDEEAVDQAWWYFDEDQDGFGWIGNAMLSCEQPSGYVAFGSDCNDVNGDTYPGAPETCAPIDLDCDGELSDKDAEDAQQFFRDLDGDGFGDDRFSVRDCARPEGYVEQGQDCEDTDPTVGRCT
mgnify:CR=1 FL=1